MRAMPSQWVSDRLRDVANINSASLPTDTDPNFEFRYLEISNVDYYGIIDQAAIEKLRFEDAPSRARRIVPHGSTVISSVRPNLQAVARIGVADSELICSTGFNVVHPNACRVAPHFLYYMLISEEVRQYLESAAIGVGYPAVADKDFGSLPVALPPVAEQSIIAAYLDRSCAAIDAAIDAKRRQIEMLASLGKSRLQRIVTRGREESPTLVATGNSWLEEVPRGWSLVMLKRLAEIQGGITLGKDYSNAETVEYPYLRVANVQDGHVDLEDVTTLDLPPSVAAGVMLRPGDVLMTEGGDLDKLGRGTVWDGQISPCLHQNHVFAVRCRTHKLLPRFLAYVTASQYGRDYFEATGKRTTNLAATNATKVGMFYIPLPSLAEQRSLVAHLDEELGRLAAIERTITRQIETLLAYRKSLIHECVTGKRRVGGTEIPERQIHA